ncbi:hypothetical protein BJX65DRAFT_262076 [Aspergillus insuetus]
MAPQHQTSAIAFVSAAGSAGELPYLSSSFSSAQQGRPRRHPSHAADRYPPHWDALAAHPGCFLANRLVFLDRPLRLRSHWWFLSA